MRLSILSLLLCSALVTPALISSAFASSAITTDTTMMTDGTIVPANPDEADTMELTETTPDPVTAAVAKASEKWQDTGLLTSQASGAMPVTMWEDMAWVTVKSALEGLAKDTLSPVQRKLTRSLLLSETKTSEIEDKPADADYLQVRLEQLLRNGSFEEIISYYNMIPEEERPAYLYPTAFTAMAGLGRFSVSCLEIKVQGKLLQDSGALPDIRNYCSLLMRANAAKPETGGKDAPLSAEMAANNLLRSPGMVSAAKSYLSGKGVKTPVSITGFGELDLVSAQAANIASLVTYPGPTQTTQILETIPANHLAILLAVPPKDDGQRFAIYAAALQRGQMSVREITTQYKLLALPRKNKAPDGAPLWEKLVILKHRLNNAAKTEDQIKLLQQAMVEFPAARSAYGLLAVSPFLADIITLYPDMQASLTQEQHKLILSLMLVANQEPPAFGGVAKKALNLASAPADVYALVDMLESDANAPPALRAFATAYEQGSRDLADAYATKKLTYEKLISLTEGSDYVMPSVEVGKLLVSAANSTNAGTVILTSLLTLRGQPGVKLHPAILALIIEMYKTVGYEQEAQELFSEVVADLLAR